jgi:hypothetical protein
MESAEQPRDGVPGEPGSIGPGPAGDSALREGVAEELDRLEKPRTNAAQGLLVLALTAFLFAGSHALVDAGWVTILIVLAVLSFHELGHLVAMRAFGYQDTRIFFIPFFGAAAAGRKHDATGAERAMVLLAGPLPGGQLRASERLSAELRTARRFGGDYSSGAGSRGW